VGCPEIVTEAGGWFKNFSHIVHLTLGPGALSTFIRFHGFPPGFRSHCMIFTVGPLPHILNLSLSFPLLGDLNMMASHDTLINDGSGSAWLPAAARSLAPRMLTGSLKFFLQEGMELTTR
jgi:hypothetical protein